MPQLLSMLKPMKRNIVFKAAKNTFRWMDDDDLDE